MAASGFTPIQLYRTTTAAAAPTAGNLADGELAINTTDEKLYFKNAAGTVKLLAANITAIANGGTGATSRQDAMDALAGAVTSGQYLRGNGTDVVMSAIQAADVPTLNQNTTGNAATATVLQTARTIGGVSFNGSANINLPGVDTAGNQNTTGTAANVTGTVAVANGGTGATTNTAARTNLGATTLGANLFTVANPSAVTFPRFNADNTVSSLDAASFRTAIGAGSGAGSVTSVSGTGTVNGISLSGTVTSSGSLTLGGALTGVNLATQVTGTLPVANGGTGATTLTANNVLLGNGTSALQVVAPGTSGNVLTSNGTTWTSAAPGGSVVQYPQNSRSANYTLVLSDAGKQIFHPASDPTERIFTIPANSSVAFPVGTVVLFTVENSGTRVDVAITSDTLVFGSGTTGTIQVPPNNTLMCIKVTATKWMANYLYQTGTPSFRQQYIAVAHFTFPAVTVYPWSDSIGFGAKYTNPATVPGTLGRGVAFSPAGNAIAVLSSDASPWIFAYPWSSTGFGTKYANPATLPPNESYGVAFSPAGNAIAVAHATTPFVSAYPWSGSGFGTKFTNPATLPTGTGNGVTFSPAGDAIAVAHDTSPFVSVYPWSGSGFGTKFTNPATLPTGTGNGVAFSPAGDAIAVAHITSPRISVYPWSGSGFGTKFTNPATLPVNNGKGVAFSPVGDAIAVADAGSPYVFVYPWSGSGFGTKYANPSTIPTSSGNGVTFSPAGNALAIAHDTSPFVSVYPWSGSGFGIKYTNPSTFPTGDGKGVAFGMQ